jgi:hypothetical protein
LPFIFMIRSAALPYLFFASKEGHSMVSSLETFLLSNIAPEPG